MNIFYYGSVKNCLDILFRRIEMWLESAETRDCPHCSKTKCGDDILENLNEYPCLETITTVLNIKFGGKSFPQWQLKRLQTLLSWAMMTVFVGVNTWLKEDLEDHTTCSASQVFQKIQIQQIGTEWLILRRNLKFNLKVFNLSNLEWINTTLD